MEVIRSLGKRIIDELFMCLNGPFKKKGGLTWFVARSGVPYTLTITHGQKHADDIYVTVTKYNGMVLIRVREKMDEGIEKRVIEKVRDVFKFGDEKGVKVESAAEFAGKKEDLLEAKRKELYEKYPVK